ncbi:methyltransferase [Kribbella sp. NPDC002412]
MDVAQQLHRLITGHQVAQAVHVAARLGLSDLLADGPRSVAELAESTAADPRSLARLMRVLVAVGLYVGVEGERFACTELGDAFRSEAPRSVAGWARMVGRPFHWQAYGELEHCVRTGESGFVAAHGVPLWEYLTEHPDEQELFDGAMTAISRMIADAVADAYDFGRFGTVVDVGGGRGLLLAAILARYPSLDGVLLDRPEVVSGARALLAAAGVAERCGVVGGSFFEALPANGDVYILKAVIHDWADAEAIEILRTCRRAMPAHGRLLLVEQVLDLSQDAMRTALSDLTMLVMAGGQERTSSEYGALLAAAGFDLSRTIPTTGDVFVIEAVPA